MSEEKKFEGMTYQDLVEELRGRRAMIIGKHPHTGQIGKLDEISDTLAGPGFIFKLDNGESCFVFKRENIQWLD